MKTTDFLIATLLCLGVSGAALAEGEARKWIDLTREGGEALYDSKCGMCHDQGGMGAGILGRRFDPEKALLVNRDDLEPAFVRSVVRNGFGIMFPVPRAEVSDAQLEAITEFLTAGKGAEQ